MRPVPTPKNRLARINSPEYSPGRPFLDYFGSKVRPSLFFLVLAWRRNEDRHSSPSRNSGWRF